jgi:acyl-coenzyme A synthetase/AMP-(fatty) acid ligase
MPTSFPLTPPPWINPSFRIFEEGCFYGWEELAIRAGKLLPLLPDHGRVAIDDRSVMMLVAALLACAQARIELVLLRRSIPRVAGASAQIDSESRLLPIGPPVDTTHAFAVLMPTSGTSGEPKLVRQDFVRLLGRIRGGWGTDSRWFLTYEPTAFGGLQVILSAAAAGGTLIVPPPGSDAAIMARFLLETKPDMVSATPSFWRVFLLTIRETEKDKLPPLKALTLGGEAADQPLLDRLSALFPRARISHIYASTEAGALFSVHDRQAGFPAIWLERGIDNIDLRLRDGILEVRSRRAMIDYASGHDRPITTDGWLITGDLVEIRGDRACFIGRADGVVNVGGVKVAVEKVEQFLLAVPGVHDAVVNAVSSPVTGHLLTAMVRPLPSVSEEALRTVLHQALEGLVPAERPRIIDFVSSDSLSGLGAGSAGKKIRMVPPQSS